MRFAVLFTLGVASTFGHDPFSSLATRRVALARAAAVAGTGLWRSAVLAEDSAAAATSEAYDASAVAPEELPPPAPPAPPAISAFDFDVPFRGEPREITPFLGRANLLVNVKFDDPETLDQMPAIGDMVSRYSERGLHVLAFPTDQGWFEADDSNTLRLKYKSVYGFGQYPAAVVFDKTDLLGGNALPLYTWMTKTLSNPWGVNRLVFNYEKFLVDERGQPRRRYPRKFPIQLMDADVRRARCGCDTPPPYSVVPPPPHAHGSLTALPRAFGFQVQALLNGQPLPPPSASLEKAWEDAKREAVKSEYSFKPGLVRVVSCVGRPKRTSMAPSSHRSLDSMPAELLCDGLARLMKARREDPTQRSIMLCEPPRGNLGAHTGPRQNVRGSYDPGSPIRCFVYVHLWTWARGKGGIRISNMYIFCPRLRIEYIFFHERAVPCLLALRAGRVPPTGAFLTSLHFHIQTTSPPSTLTLRLR